MTDFLNRWYGWVVAIAGLTLLVLLMAVSCSPRQVVAPVVTAAPTVSAVAPVAVAPVAAPVVVQQSHDGFLSGMLMGHLLSSSGGPQTTNVTKNVTINKTVTETPKPTTTPPVMPKPVAAAPAPTRYSAPATYRPTSSFRGGRK